MQDSTVASKFSNAKKLSDVNLADYDAIFYVGGHGPVIDLASDPVNINLANKVRVTLFCYVIARSLTTFCLASSGPQARLSPPCVMDPRKALQIFINALFDNFCAEL